MRKSLWTTSAGGAVRIGIIVVACLFLSATGARADTVLTYTGTDFMTADGLYTTMDKVTGTFVLSSPLPANLPPDSIGFPSDESALLVSWRLSDGVNTFTGNGPTLTDFEFTTGSHGEIIDWDVEIINSVGQIETFNFFDDKNTEDEGATFGVGISTGGSSIGDGMWSSATTAAPEPGIRSMMFSGLLGLGLLVGLKRYRGNRLATIA